MYFIQRYEPCLKQDWDSLVRDSKNGSFLFYRDYLEYHSNRYNECSFIFRKRQKVVALIPGNIEGSTYYSHGYLTFGGFVLLEEVKTKTLLLLFDLLHEKLKDLDINEVIYKPVPFIYHRQPAQEDLYALFRFDAQKIGCQLSSTIFNYRKVKMEKSRKDGLKRAFNADIKVRESKNLDNFWTILSTNLREKYNVIPVHDIDEITYLRSKFPDNIKLFVAEQNNEMQAGVLVFEHERVCHTQYIAVSEKGKSNGALDSLLYKLVTEIYFKVPVFDFGYSTEKMGHYLNENLISQKEGFGARGVV